MVCYGTLNVHWKINICQDSCLFTMCAIAMDCYKHIICATCIAIFFYRDPLFNYNYFATLFAQIKPSHSHWKKRKAATRPAETQKHTLTRKKLTIFCVFQLITLWKHHETTKPTTSEKLIANRHLNVERRKVEEWKRRKCGHDFEWKSHSTCNARLCIRRPSDQCI